MTDLKNCLHCYPIKSDLSVNDSEEKAYESTVSSFDVSIYSVYLVTELDEREERYESSELCYSGVNTEFVKNRRLYFSGIHI